MSARPPTDRGQINRRQRERRAASRRVDFYASPEAMAAIEARRAREYPGSVRATNSAVLNAIVCEWAELTCARGTGTAERGSSTGPPGITPPVRAYACAPASNFHGEPELLRTSRRRARAKDFQPIRCSVKKTPATCAIDDTARRVVCGARRRRDGQPCEALSVAGKRRCKWHGGCSTGPRSPEGRERALRNLRRATRSKT